VIQNRQRVLRCVGHRSSGERQCRTVSRAAVVYRRRSHTETNSRYRATCRRVKSSYITTALMADQPPQDTQCLHPHHW